MVKLWRLKLNGVEYTSYRQLKFTKERNKLGYIEFVMFSCEASDYTNNIDYNKKIELDEYDDATASYRNVFKGYIRTVEKASFNKSKVTGFSPAIKLFDRTWDTRQEYTNIASDVIFSAIASGIMNVGTNAITNVITTRFDLDNKLRSVAKIANVNNAEWWEGEDGLGEDTINLDTSRYTSISVDTIEIGRSSSVTRDKIDSDKIYNCITVLGKGDGINQVKSTSYGFCTYQPSTTAAMTSTSISVTISDSTGFASTNGIIYINNEKIRFNNRTGNNLYNLYTWNPVTSAYEERSVTTSKTALAHSSGMRVWYAGTVANEFTKTNPDTLSSVDTYGIREYSYYDKRIVLDLTGDPNESAGIINMRLFDRFKTPVRTIEILKKRAFLGEINIGKTVTIVDSSTGLNNDFKVFSIEMSNDRTANKRGLRIVLNNLQYNFSTEVDELSKNMDTSGMYEQGATNIFTVDQAENCDVGFPLTLRFYLPTDTKAINKVLLNFQIKNYRTYLSSGTTSNGSEQSVVQDVVSYAGGVAFTNTSSWRNIIGLGTDDDDFEGMYLTYDIKYFSSDQTAYVKSPGGIVWYWRIMDSDGNYYPAPNGDAGGIFAAGAYWSNDSFPGGNISLYIPGNQKNKTFILQVKREGGDDVDWNFYVAASYMAFSQHTHEVTYGINEPDIVSDPHVSVEVNNTSIGVAYTDVDNTGIDITSYVEEIGAGNWVEIKFTPDQNLRIEASASVQIYLESKV